MLNWQLYQQININNLKILIMKFSIREISPETAQKILETSPYNRVSKTSRRTAETYAEAMKRGEWQLNGECIVFDENNTLMDGHHRMLAVTIANIPVTFAVCSGVKRDAFTTYNCGLRTNLSQILGMKDVKNNVLIMGIIGINYNLSNTGRIRSNNGTTAGESYRTVTSDYNLYLSDVNGYNEAAELANRLKSYGNVIKSSWIGGVLYFLTHKGGYKLSEVLPFFEALCHLETSGITPCDTLRSFIIRRRMTNMKIEDGYLAALLIKSWNAFITGKNLKQIRFNQDKEDYPKFILNR